MTVSRINTSHTFHNVEYTFKTNKKEELTIKVFKDDNEIDSITYLRMKSKSWDFLNNEKEAFLFLEKRKKGDKDFQKIMKKLPEVDDPNSDDEFKRSDRKEMASFDPTAKIPVFATTLKCKDNNIKGGHLLHIAMSVVYRLFLQLEKRVEQGVCQPLEVDNGTLKITQPYHWILSIGRWKGMSPWTEIYSKEETLNGVIVKDSPKFKISNYRLFINEHLEVCGRECSEHSSLVKGLWQKDIKRDLTYPQINTVIRGIKENHNIGDSELVYIQLGLLRREEPYYKNAEEKIGPINFPGVLTFFKFLNCLMFGMEPSGLNAGLILGLMSLQLIAQRKLTYNNLFCVNDHGGCYPFANFGDNENTYVEVAKIVQNVIDNKDGSMQDLRQNPVKSPIGIKAAFLMTIWLKNKLPELENELLDDALKTIDKELEELVKYFFFLEVKKKKSD